MSFPEHLRVRVIGNLDALEELASDWTDLWNRCPGATPFQRAEWVLAWTNAFGPREIYVIEVRDAERLVGLAPLFRYRSGSENILAPLAASISDYLDWLIDPACSNRVVEGIFDAIETSIDFDRLDLIDLPQHSCLLNFASEDWDCEKAEETACPVLFLPRIAKSVEEIVPSKLRHNLRTARRRMERAGPSQVELATEATLDEFLAAMMQLHGDRWTHCGMPGVLAENAVQEFHRIAARGLLQQNVLRLYGLRFNGQFIATLYALAEQDTMYCYLQGFNPVYGEFSPGAQILAAVIDDAIRDGKIRVDFLRGREAYKYAWGAVDQETYRLSLRLRAGVRLPRSPAVAT